VTFSPGYVEPVPPMISPWTPGWGTMQNTVGNSPSSGSSTTNIGVWYPLYVPTVCVAKRVWWANGSSVSGTYNLESGIYRDGGHKPGAKLITSGSVAQGTASQVQFADITDTTLTPGLYWFYLSSSTGSATLMRVAPNIGSTFDEILGFQQASIGPGSAPETATPIEFADATVYIFGFSTTTIT